jgi:hypothetical protein
VIFDLILEAIASNGFKEVQSSSETFRYFTKLPSEERHLVIANMTTLPPVSKLNETAKLASPGALIEAPSFSKNTDLILLYRVNTLAEYETIEQQILEYEEDKYNFKKYFLYFSSAEEDVLSTAGFSEITEALKSPAEFDSFKKDRTAPSIYAFAARMFIKLPFLQLEVASKGLVPLPALLGEAVQSEGLSSTWKLASMAVGEADKDPNEFIRMLIDEELEILKASDSSL